MIWGRVLAIIDDWTRGLTTNYAETSASAKNPSLQPIQSPRPSKDLANLVETAAAQLRGWALADRQESGDEITLRFVRTTRLWRFKDDITVHIRPVNTDSGGPQSFTVSAESRSRVGKGDFGQNSRNLKELMDRIRGLLQ